MIKFAHNLFYSYLCNRKIKDRIIRELSSSFSHRESLSNERQSRRRKEDTATGNCQDAAASRTEDRQSPATENKNFA